MKDAELVYSLYVQANPVPDPDLLSLSRDEAALLTLERSPDMITEEQTRERQPTQTKPKRLAVVLSAAAVLIVAVVGAAILVNGEAEPIAAADANPVVMFDGATCTYEGPTLIEEGASRFSLTNSADEAFNFTSFRMEEPALSRELEEHPLGTDWEEPPGSPIPDAEMSFVAVLAGQTYRPDWLLPPGTYLLECTTGTQAGGIPEHVWRAAQLEVVASG